MPESKQYVLAMAALVLTVGTAVTFNLKPAVIGGPSKTLPKNSLDMESPDAPWPGSLLNIFAMQNQRGSKSIIWANVALKNAVTDREDLSWDVW